VTEVSTPANPKQRRSVRVVLGTAARTPILGRRRRREASGLAELGCRVDALAAAGSDPDEVAAVLLAALSKTFGFPRLVLLRVDRQDLVPQASRGLADPSRSPVKAREATALWAAQASRRSVVVPAAAAAAEAPLSRLLPGPGTVPAVPMIVHGDVCGFVLADLRAARRCSLELLLDSVERFVATATATATATSARPGPRPVGLPSRSATAAPAAPRWSPSQDYRPAVRAAS